ncbi:porin [Lampropedia aestuarii]|uniref:porin n=1 Tax=Lampropedia aestuarii TaxID=2562762 RepID=UPI0024694DEC|nr:porin [Lampropedia aestuarii]MDH5858823.1 porin [Lampropedia aestuarii]
MTTTASKIALLACVSVLAASAQAQSSVTLSGSLDIGVFKGYQGGTQVGGISRSMFAFSGVEDLGGGLSATFKLASRFKLQDGQIEDPKSYFGAESTVGLKGSFGHVRLGRAMTALWQNDWHFDPWYNYDGIASPAWYLWHGNSAADPNYSSDGVSFSRLNNGIYYEAPTIGGFTGYVSAGLQKQVDDKHRSLSVALRYAYDQLSLLAAMERTPEDKRVTFVAAKYAMGPWQVMAAYDHEKLPQGDKNRSYTLSGQYTVGSMSYKLGYGRQQDYKANFFGASAVHAFSKRTNVYLSVGNQGKNLWGRDSSKTAYGVGLAHSF